jgi:predicted nucleotidyltransferase
MNTTRRAKLADALTHILHTLATEYHPEKVILFGSLAAETVGEWSDLDLVIVKDTTLPFLQRLKEVALLCRAQVGVDYLVYTPNEFADMVAQENPFIVNEVLHRGKVVYEREPTSTFVRAQIP